MLVLSRKVGERIVIGPNVVITVIAAKNGRVRLGIEAPSNVPVHREEVSRRVAEREREWAAPVQPDVSYYAEFA